MNFQVLRAKYQRLYKENAAWKLLRADNAPLIAAFLCDLFSEEAEVSFSQARTSLDAELERCRNLGIWETETDAGIYLNHWIRAGWLRELDDVLTKTEACDVALRFCRGLDEPAATTTASHLRIVQEAVRDLVVALSSNIDERIYILEQKKSAIQQEIDSLNAGHITELPEMEQRERVREVYQLASVLTGDFRRVEDEIRQLDQEMRIQIIEGDACKGEVLLAVMEKESMLSETDAGSAFESFFRLLCDQDRSQELREQLQIILDHPAAEHLRRQQHRFLGRLMRELSKESERVFKIRRRTEESLRTYIESGAAQESRAVTRLLGKLEKLAIDLRQSGYDPRTPTRISLPVGTPVISSPENIRLRTPEEKLDTSGVTEELNSREPSLQILQGLDKVRIRQVAHRMHKLLGTHGPMSIGAIAKQHPIKAGLEELVACIRVAKSVCAPELSEKESLVINDEAGKPLQVSIPVFLLEKSLFPQDLDALHL